MIVYKVENLVNGKLYIGQTTETLGERWRKHLSDAARKRHNMLLHRAIRKYGPDAFRVTVVNDAAKSQEALNVLERIYIQRFRSYENGYNMTLGGEGAFGLVMPESAKKRLAEIARNMPEEQRRKIAEKVRGNTNRRGKPLPMSARIKLSQYRGPLNSRYGTKHTEATIRKIRIAALNRTVQPRTGMHHTEETKRRMREAWVRRKAQKVSVESS